MAIADFLEPAVKDYAEQAKATYSAPIDTSQFTGRGFVAMGGKERADDVPARLSKNEFVFTADAVRNAGGGDIDKGAEVMENLMNNLEQGGEVSEDSQGLEGAQAMYDQQQMLQSRII